MGSMLGNMTVYHALSEPGDVIMSSCLTTWIRYWGRGIIRMSHSGTSGDTPASADCGGS